MSVIPNIKKRIRDRFIGSSTAEDKLLYTNFSISNYIRPTVFDEQQHIWLTNDGEFAWISELSPRIRMGGETAEVFEQILSKIPEDVYVQILLHGSKNIENYLAQYRQDHLVNNNETITRIVENCANFLKNATENIINEKFSTQIKNNRVFLILKTRNENKLLKIKSTIKNLLNSNHFAPEELSAEELKIVFWELINPNHDIKECPEYNEWKFFNKQLMARDNKISVHQDHIIIDKRFFKALTPIKYPKYAHISEFGLKLGDYLSRGLNKNQFVNNYLIAVNLTRTSASEVAWIKRNKMIVKGGGNTGSRVKKEKQEIDAIIDGIEERKPIFKIDMNIWISGKSYKELQENADAIKSYWMKKSQQGEREVGGVILEDYTNKLLPVFIGSLPGGVDKEYYEFVTKSNEENHFVNEICQFLPLEVDYQGNYPNHLFLSRRGQICGIDIFRSNTAKNGIILAESGGGKSVLANYIACNEFTRGTQVFIIDIGESYKNLCNEFGGEYISISMQSNISFNPFDALQKIYSSYIYSQQEDIKNELVDLMDYVIGFVYQLGASLNSDDATREEKYIKGKLQDIIPYLLEHNEDGRILEINDINSVIQNNYSQDARLVNFGVHLKSWCVGGVYHKFVSGASTIDLSSPFFVLDLQNVSSQPELRDALIYLISSSIASFIYSNHNPNKKYLVLIDEMHEYLGKSRMMEQFFDKAYRKFRKHNAAIIGITQSFEDIYNTRAGDLSTAGNAIMTNSPWQFFLNQKETAVNAMLQSGLFSFSEIEKEMLKTTKTEQGFYSEIFLINPNNEKVIIRFVLDRYFYYLTSTEPRDKDKIRNIAEEYQCSMPEARDILVEIERRNSDEN